MKTQTAEKITKILLLGETGVGKSSFGNYIIGEKKFESKGTASSVTKEIDGHISEKDSYKDVYIIDSPGTQDSRFQDSNYLEILKNNFQKKNAGVKAICILINFENPRFASYLQQQMHIYSLLFPIEDFWEHIAIIFTKARYSLTEEEFNETKQELESENGLINEIIKYIKERIEEINESKKGEANFKKIRVPREFPVFYIDSNLKVDESKNQRTKEEVERLIQWARNKNYLDLENINKNHIDVNYLRSERIEDYVLSEEQFIENTKLKIYIKKYYSQFNKETFHHEIIHVKEPKPFKIEEIKEEEKIGKEKLIVDEENYKLYNIEHKAVKSKIRITEKESTKEWEDIDNQTEEENSRPLYTDKLEKRISTKWEPIGSIERCNNKIVENYQLNKITKTFLNNKEQKNKEKIEPIDKKTITKTISKSHIPKKDYLNGLKISEDITQETTVIKYGNGKKEGPKTEIIDRVTRYWKPIEKRTPLPPKTEGNKIIKRIHVYKREDETDEYGNLKNPGKPNEYDETVEYTEKTTITRSPFYETINLDQYLQETGKSYSGFYIFNLILSFGTSKMVIDERMKINKKIQITEYWETTYDKNHEEIKKIMTSYDRRVVDYIFPNEKVKKWFVK